MLKADTADAKQRYKAMADACQLSIQKWQTKVVEMQDDIQRAHKQAVDRTQQKLIEDYLKEIGLKNQQILALEQKREMIESKLLAETDSAETQRL